MSAGSDRRWVTVSVESMSHRCMPHPPKRPTNEVALDVQEKNVVILGDSNIVGTPMSVMLRDAGAGSVTVCHRIAYRDLFIDRKLPESSDLRATAAACLPRLPGPSSASCKSRNWSLDQRKGALMGGEGCFKGWADDGSDVERDSDEALGSWEAERGSGGAEQNVTIRVSHSDDSTTIEVRVCCFFPLVALASLQAIVRSAGGMCHSLSPPTFSCSACWVRCPESARTDSGHGADSPRAAGMARGSFDLALRQSKGVQLKLEQHIASLVPHGARPSSCIMEHSRMVPFVRCCNRKFQQVRNMEHTIPPTRFVTAMGCSACSVCWHRHVQHVDTYNRK
jgi:hypothetical protein